jgi:hypothetical protein
MYSRSICLLEIKGFRIDPEIKVWKCLVNKEGFSKTNSSNETEAIFFKTIYKTRKCMAEEHIDKQKSGLQQ